MAALNSKTLWCGLTTWRYGYITGAWICTLMPSHVLDYYHACEHLYGFSGLAFKATREGNNWAEEQKAKLLESKATEVIQAIAAVA